MKWLTALWVALILPASARQISNNTSSGMVARWPLGALEGRFLEYSYADLEQEWKGNVKCGAKLLQGMRSSDSKAGALYGVASVKSIFDGDCKDSLNIWNYVDDTPEMQERNDKECDFEKANLKQVMNGLGRKPSLEIGGTLTDSVRRSDSEVFEARRFSSLL